MEVITQIISYLLVSASYKLLHLGLKINKPNIWKCGIDVVSGNVSVIREFIWEESGKRVTVEVINVPKNNWIELNNSIKYK